MATGQPLASVILTQGLISRLTSSIIATTVEAGVPTIAAAVLMIELLGTGQCSTHNSDMVVLMLFVIVHQAEACTGM